LRVPLLCDPASRRVCPCSAVRLDDEVCIVGDAAALDGTK
jgi:hypothetical protein